MGLVGKVGGVKLGVVVRMVGCVGEGDWVWEIFCFFAVCFFVGVVATFVFLLRGELSLQGTRIVVVLKHEIFLFQNHNYHKQLHL